MHDSLQSPEEIVPA